MARFDEFPLLAELLESLEKQGFVEPFPIQEQSIPIALEGKDIIGIADTGTGKTVAFSLPMIQKINPNVNATQGLIVCPTRELAMQVADVIRKLAKYIPELKVATIYGGQKIDIQLRQLKKGVHIVVGTPGRILDHIRQKSLSLKDISMVVLDEADEMLSMGFRPDMERILKETPQERQTLLFSATMSQDILRLTKRYQTNPETVKIESNKNHADSLIEHTFFKVDRDDKTNSLAYLLKKHSPQQAIIFCNTRHRVKKVVEQLESLGVKTECLHGDVRQSARNRILESFRSGKTKIIIATDVAARGIDVADVEIVFHYELPEDIESYVHRSGRTGRAGKEGKALSFISERDKQLIGKIENGTGILINKGELPNKQEREKDRVLSFLAEIKETILSEDLGKHTQVLEEHLNDADYSAVEIAAALLHKKFKQQKQALSSREPRRSSGNDRGRRSSSNRGSGSRSSSGRGSSGRGSSGRGSSGRGSSGRGSNSRGSSRRSDDSRSSFNGKNRSRPRTSENSKSRSQRPRQK